MKKLLLCLLLPGFLFGQVQIGEDIDGEAAGDLAGISTSLSESGLRLAVGALRNDDNGEDSGHVRVYENIQGEWIQIGQNIVGEASGDLFGVSTSLSNDGNILAAGGSLNSDNGNFSGHARVYENNDGIWVQIGNDIDGENEFDAFGENISLAGNGSILAVGSANNSDSGTSAGSVRIFENQSNNWVQMGESITGEDSSDLSGRSIQLSDDGFTIIIGADLNDDNGFNSGHARIFRYNGSAWNQIGNDIDGEQSGDLAGLSVSMSSDGTIVAVGARGNSDNGQDSGHVRVFENQNNKWNQIGNSIEGENNGDEFGFNLSLSSNGEILAIGGRLNDDSGKDAGHVRIFQNLNGVWTQMGSTIVGEDSGDQSGLRVDLSSLGTTLSIGARLNDGNGDNSGHVRVYDLSAILSTPENNTTTFTLFPNPATTQVTIQIRDESSLEKVTIYNNLGQLVMTSTIAIIDTSQLATGIYVVEITTTEGKGVEKLIVE